MTTALANLTPELKEDETVRHVLKFRSAWGVNDYVKFFKLYRTAPKMSAYLIDWFVKRERLECLRHVIKAYVFLSVPVVSDQSVRILICIGSL